MISDLLPAADGSQLVDGHNESSPSPTTQPQLSYVKQEQSYVEPTPKQQQQETVSTEHFGNDRNLPESTSLTVQMHEAISPIEQLSEAVSPGELHGSSDSPDQQLYRTLSPEQQIMHEALSLDRQLLCALSPEQQTMAVKHEGHGSANRSLVTVKCKFCNFEM